jgi:hypothetical protein
LLEGHKLHGNKWTEIAKMVQGRYDRRPHPRRFQPPPYEPAREQQRMAGGLEWVACGGRKSKAMHLKPLVQGADG